MRLLITAGPTCEDLDRVRCLTNRSSGRMGYALAEAAVAAGHEVVLVSGPVALAPPAGLAEFVAVRSAAEMLAAVARRLKAAEALLMCAAVADYRPARRLPGKLAKRAGPLTLKLVRTPDILRELSTKKGKRLFVGFALEGRGLTAAARARARKKLREKRLDLVVLNGPASLGAATIRAEILDGGGGREPLGELSKAKAARRIIARVAELAVRPAPPRPRRRPGRPRGPA